MVRLIVIAFVCSLTKVTGVPDGPDDVQCIPISQCKAAMQIAQYGSKSKNAIRILQQIHCGYNREAFVRCDSAEQARSNLIKQEDPEKCIPISQCSIANKLIKEGGPNLVSILRKAHCGYEKEAKINCHSIEKTISDTRHSTFDETSEKTADLPRPELQECGIQGSIGKIFGGESTSLDDFPWLALLYYEDETGKIEFNCHGTLINQWYILTAAHCLDSGLLRGSKLHSVVLGEYDTRTEKDCIDIDGYLDCSEPAKRYGFDSFTAHSGFDPAKGINDIGLIKLSEKVKYSEFITPICLSDKSYTLFENETFWISGWGRTELVKRSPIKLKAEIPKVSKEACRSTWKRQISDNVICAGIADGTDTCKGDSGGPLMIQRGIEEEYVTYQIGVVSFGLGTCGSGPAIYTYVPKYRDWIENNMR